MLMDVYGKTPERLCLYTFPSHLCRTLQDDVGLLSHSSDIAYASKLEPPITDGLGGQKTPTKATRCSCLGAYSLVAPSWKQLGPTSMSMVSVHRCKGRSKTCLATCVGVQSYPTIVACHLGVRYWCGPEISSTSDEPAQTLTPAREPAPCC